MFGCKRRYREHNVARQRAAVLNMKVLHGVELTPAEEAEHDEVSRIWKTYNDSWEMQLVLLKDNLRRWWYGYPHRYARKAWPTFRYNRFVAVHIFRDDPKDYD